MRDDPYSKFVREKKGLDQDWRVYKWEALGGDFGPGPERVRLTGAIARPACRHDGRQEGDPVWITPTIGKSQMTISQSEYRRLAEENSAEQ